jgi:hypothetical protein
MSKPVRKPVRIEATGPRPVDDAWEQYIHTPAWPTWAPQIRDVRGVDGRIAPGDRGVVHGPFPVRVPFTIVAVDPAVRRWTWRVGFGPLGVVLDHGVDPVGSGSSAWADVHAPRLLVRAYAPLARLALRRLVAA